MECGSGPGSSLKSIGAKYSQWSERWSGIGSDGGCLWRVGLRRVPVAFFLLYVTGCLYSLFARTLRRLLRVCCPSTCGVAASIKSTVDQPPCHGVPGNAGHDERVAFSMLSVDSGLVL